jgi:hypothetical protein
MPLLVVLLLLPMLPSLLIRTSGTAVRDMAPLTARHNDVPHVTELLSSLLLLLCCYCDDAGIARAPAVWEEWSWCSMLALSWLAAGSFVHVGGMLHWRCVRM